MKGRGSNLQSLNLSFGLELRCDWPKWVCAEASGDPRGTIGGPGGTLGGLGRVVMMSLQRQTVSSKNSLIF